MSLLGMLSLKLGRSVQWDGEKEERKRSSVTMRPTSSCAASTESPGSIRRFDYAALDLEATNAKKKDIERSLIPPWH